MFVVVTNSCKIHHRRRGLERGHLNRKFLILDVADEED